MSNFKVIILFLASSAYFISCDSNSSKEDVAMTGSETLDSLDNQEEILYQHVMASHDNVMPEMSNIMTLNKKVKALIATTEDIDHKEELSLISLELEAANEGMMDWMRNFDPNLEQKSHEETMTYLLSEQNKIESVKKSMEAAIKNAKGHL